MSGFLIHPSHGLPRDYWASVWVRMDEEGLTRSVFCDGSICDADSFADLMSCGHVHPFCVFRGADLVALVWLTNLEGKMCRGHFCVFKKYWPESRHIGSFVRSSLLAQKYDDGSYCFDVLVGMIPKINSRAVNVAKKAGFMYVGAIPFGAWIKERGVSVDMVVLAATRGKDEDLH